MNKQQFKSLFYTNSLLVLVISLLFSMHLTAANKERLSFRKNEPSLTESSTKRSIGKGLQMITSDANTPVFPVQNYSFTISDAAALGTEVGVITASDPEGGAVSYIILGGNTNGAFIINASTGAITVSKKLNYHTQSSYNLIVKATDSDNFSNSIDVTVSVTAEENKSIFSSLKWSTVANQEYIVNEAQGEVVDNRLYTFGGFDSQKSTFTPTSRAYVYYPVTNKWSSIAPMPPMNGTSYGGVTHAGFTTDGTDIYFAGGYTSNSSGTGQIFGTKEVWKYVVKDNRYERLPDLPITISAGQLEYLNGKLHHIGGTNSARTMDLGDHYVLDLDNLANGWKTLATLPNPRQHAGSTVYEGKIYYIGGQTGHDSNLSAKKDVHRYDPITNTWAKMADLPVPSGAMGRGHISSSVVTIGNRIVVIGGETMHSSGRTNLVSAYSPANDTWENLTSLPQERYSGVAANLNGSLYYTGGSSSSTTYKGEFNITPSGYTLTLSTTGSGTVTRTPELATYTAGDSLELLATPDPGYVFSGWSGDVTGTTNPLTVVMNSNKTVTATFTLSQAPLLLFTPSSVVVDLPMGQQKELKVNLNNSDEDPVSVQLTASDNTGSAPAWLLFAGKQLSGENNLSFHLGEAGNELLFTLDASALTAGTYSAVVQATASGYTPAQLEVSLQVASYEEGLRPYVTAVRPANGEISVLLSQSVSVDIAYPSGQSIDGTTVTPATVKLYKVEGTTRTEVTGTAVNATAAGDAITLSASLAVNTTYEFFISDQVKDGNGYKMQPFTSRFKTISSLSDIPTELAGVSFTEQILVDRSFGSDGFTSLVIGPDNRLYATTSGGKIERWDLQEDGTLTNHVTISPFGGSRRLLIGLRFDPAATASHLVAWISHSSPGFNDVPDWTGKISRIELSNPASPQVTDYVINLPRSYKDHATNGLDFGPDGALYFPQGSNTAMGLPDAAWGHRPERLLSAAVLRLDLARAQQQSLPIDAKTEEGGSYNPGAANAALTIYATGIRNAYDLVWHSNGQLYVPANGSAAGGNTPALSSGMVWSNGQVYTGPDIAAMSDVRVTQSDYLFRVEQGGYYGHPNVLRHEYIMNGGNPTAEADAGEVTWSMGGQSYGYAVGTPTEPNFRGWAYDFGLNKSPNGVIEYKSSNFGGKLQGKLLVCRFSGGDDIMVLEPGTSNQDIIRATEGDVIPGLRRPFSNPLDITEDVRTGNLYISEYFDGNGDGQPRITLLRASDNTTPPPPAVSGNLINAGGSQYLDSQSRTWTSDVHFTGGLEGAKSFDVAGTSDDALYLDYRYASSGAPFSYSMPLDTGLYNIKFHFVEPYYGAPGGKAASGGERVFHVDVEGQRVLQSYDIFKQDGAGKAVIKTFSGIGITDGVLNINFTSVANNAIISAIEVEKDTTTTRTETFGQLVNAGGGQYLDSQLRNWTVDTGFSGGEAGVKSFDVAGTVEDGLYLDYRYATSGAPFSYNISLPSGKYDLILHFLEPYYGAPGGKAASGGERVFHVDVEGQRVLQSYDIFKQDGAGKAVVKTFSGIDITDGVLNILFTSVANNAIISAIEVISAPSSPNNYTLTTNIIGSGTVTRSPDQPSYLDGTTVSLTASPATGYTFSGWSGDVTGMDNPLFLVMNNDKTITATYTNIQQASKFINTGGNQYLDNQARTWSADTDFTGGVAGSKSFDVAGTSDDALYLNYRYASSGVPFGYNVPVEVGFYNIKLHFVEPYYGAPGGKVASGGERVFHVDVEGQRVLNSYDIYKQDGAGTAVVKTFSGIGVVDGIMDIDFTSVANSAIISAIEIEKDTTRTLSSGNFVNAGGGNYLDGQSRIWSADTGFSGGLAGSKSFDVAGTTEDALYLDYRYASSGAPFSYNMPVDTGYYNIKLHFVEPYYGAPGGKVASGGERVFHVDLEGQRVLQSYDIYAQDGAAKAVVKSFSGIGVTDGILNIDFTSITNSAIISAIEVEKGVKPGADTTPPVVSVKLSGATQATNSYVNEVTVTVEASDLGGSGLASVQYSINDGVFQSYSSPFKLTEVGSYKVQTKAIDGGGNESAIVEKNFNVVRGSVSLVVENMDRFPETDRLVFSLIQIPWRRTDPETTPYNENHNKVRLRISNKGTDPMHISKLTMTNPKSWKIATLNGVEFDPNTSLPINVNSGAYVDAVVEFIANNLGGRVKILKDKLIISSNDVTNPNREVSLNGLWQNEGEGDDEPYAQEIIQTFGYLTKTGYDVNDGENYGTFVVPNSDEISASFFVRADASKPVSVVQMAAYHGCCSSIERFQWYNKGATSHSTLFTHEALDGQSLLPRKDGSATALARGTFNPSGAFGLKVATSYSDRTRNKGDKLGFRIWKAIDANGNIIPDTYIVGHDYIGVDVTNYDYNDNLYYISNVKPEADVSSMTTTSSSSLIATDTNELLNKQLKIKVHPNPLNSSDKFSIEFSNFEKHESLSLTLHDMAGRVITTLTAETNESGGGYKEVHLDKYLNHGMYLLRVVSPSGVISTKLIVK